MIILGSFGTLTDTASAADRSKGENFSGPAS